MTVFEWVAERLESLGIAAYPVAAPADAERPYAAYQRVGGRSISFLGTELPSVKNERVQIAIWAERALQVEALGLQLENLLMSAEDFQVEPIGSPIDDHDEETGLYGSRQDFSIWSPR
ncbi:hypothetical protein J2W32_000328 [Variovorax boronicumulans]|uniref:DUF3168 domain-containing protein n=1 Tax=Variovorax boronicumulans TaxID=436515 RepID=A0AAW8CPI0_9BURK|nr:DUF3168 domain-containing protein [Variovorax boronicumulans]MDP9891231.1 hypothetical protein [Variovorax boronicumulans]MDQ0051299.1 hypothetical protein [Variovorax boronicumulans]